MQHRVAAAVAVAALLAATLASAQKPPLVSDLTDAEIQQHRARLREDPHMALYVLMTKVDYTTEQQARDAVTDVHSGRTSLMQAVQDANAQDREERKEEGRHGEMGIITIDEVDPRIAEIAFDVRLPMADEHSANLLGPVCTAPSTCSVFVVFQRYREGFFSDAWFELQQFCVSIDMDFKEMLQSLDDDDWMRLVAFQAWPGVDVPTLKVKLADVRKDVKKIGSVRDPSAMPMTNRGKPVDKEKFERELEARIAFFDKLPRALLDAKPELYAMDIAEIIAKGYADGTDAAGGDVAPKPDAAAEAAADPPLPPVDVEEPTTFDAGEAPQAEDDGHDEF